jgi:hypothetical protein
MYSAREDIIMVPGDLNTRGRRFSNEALRLLQLEGEPPVSTVPLLQGFLCLYLYEANLGDGNKAIQFTDEFYRVYAELDLEEEVEAARGQPEEARARLVCSQAAWGVYLMTA